MTERHSRIERGRGESDLEIRDVAGVVATSVQEASKWGTRPFETFPASQIGKCPRQVYISLLGLREESASGRIETGQLLQNHIEDILRDRFPHFQTPLHIDTEVGNVRFVGRANAYDPDTETVFDIKPRAAWYKFNPPIQRHIDQLQVYMHGSGADHGRILYVSMKDLSDIRAWPPEDIDATVVEYDSDRIETLAARGERIRDSVIARGIATTAEEIPFQKCGCYFCQEEELDLPSVSGFVWTDIDSSQMNTVSSPISSTDSASTRGPEIDTGEVVQATGRHVPDGLKTDEVWVVWTPPEKIARAPWETGHMYPVRWGVDSGVDPRTTYGKAKMVTELPIEEVFQSWPFPDDELPSQVLPGILLPHERSESQLLVVDLDDVRDPDTGRMTTESLEVVRDLGGYAEVSLSGSGVHVFARGRLPDDIAVVQAPLHEAGSIEIYDHSRFVATTWNSLDGSPDAIPLAQNKISELVRQYQGRKQT